MTPLLTPWLPFPLEPGGHPPVGYELGPADLTLTAAAGTDMFVDPAGSGQAPDAGRLTGTPPAGDFSLAAHVSVGFASTYDAGVLVLHAGPRRWAKLCFELSPQLTPTAVTVVTRGTSDDCNSFEVTGDSLWLRITRSGAAWAFHASTDGGWWRLLRYFSLGVTTGPAGPARRAGPAAKRAAPTARLGSAFSRSRRRARAARPPSGGSRSAPARQLTCATGADLCDRRPAGAAYWMPSATRQVSSSVWVGPSASRATDTSRSGSPTPRTAATSFATPSSMDLSRRSTSPSL